MDDRPIGVFDSGFGGLTVLSSLCTALPHEEFVYVADTLHLTYGSRSSQEIIAYTKSVLDWLVTKNAKAVVFASNAPSVIALPILRDQYDSAFFGLVDAGVNSVMHYQELIGADLGSLGIIGAKNTIATRVHENALRTAGFMGEIYTQTCPLFVHLVEEGIYDENVLQSVISYYLRPLLEKKIECLLLAGTHYSVIYENLQNFFDGKVQILDPNYMIAREVVDYLESHSLMRTSDSLGSVEFAVTGNVATFQSSYSRFIHIDDSRIREPYFVELG